MYVSYRRPHRGYGSEIWHRAGVPPQERLWLGLDRPDPSSWPGRPKSASGGPCSPNRATKVAERPKFSGGGSGQIRSRTSPRGPAASSSARGRSAALCRSS